MRYTTRKGEEIAIEYIDGEIRIDGGKGSGNFGHAGRKGERGGSAKESGTTPTDKRTVTMAKTAISDMENEWVNTIWDDHHPYSNEEAKKVREDFKKKWNNELKKVCVGSEYNGSTYLGNDTWENNRTKKQFNTEELVRELLWDFEDEGFDLNTKTHTNIVNK